ncbi:MAG: carbohydrate kinase, partial [Cyanobacteria bacterium J06639_1]
MNPPRVICVGEILFDCLANELGRSLPEVSSWNPFPGGAPANVACALARLGVESAWIGCVGDDEAGAALLGVLRSRGVDITGAQIHPTAPTRQVFVTRSLAGEREFAGFGDRPTTEFADAFLRADSLPESLFVTADILAAGTLGLAYPETRAALERSLALASQHGMQIAIDLNWRPVFWPDPDSAPAIVRAVLPYADYLKCSDEEARWLFGTDDPTAIAAQLPRARG